ncbi:UNVERIFIED_CONTAM: hypothetical protein Sradi_3718400 [Sesamum radiatum]|uniref:Uncharacterized protein n=1 Tax=Sesamum radiatum TaxID=300843 RepID=A0AAW2PXN4_SESRA
MAGVLTVTASSVGVCGRLLAVLPPLSAGKALCASLSSSKCYSSMSWNSLQCRTTVLPSRKLVIRAARTESKGVTLGFRAPDFELPEPLTGKVWKLDDFESYPALLDGRRPFELVYHGQFDDSRPSNNMPITGRDLSLAIDSVLSGQPVPSIQKPRLHGSENYHSFLGPSRKTPLVS